MSSRVKYARRSQRSNKTGVPLGIFYYHAEKERNARYSRNINNIIFNEERDND